MKFRLLRAWKSFRKFAIEYKYRQLPFKLRLSHKLHPLSSDPYFAVGITGRHIEFFFNTPAPITVHGWLELGCREDGMYNYTLLKILNFCSTHASDGHSLYPGVNLLQLKQAIQTIEDTFQIQDIRVERANVMTQELEKYMKQIDNFKVMKRAHEETKKS